MRMSFTYQEAYGMARWEQGIRLAQDPLSKAGPGTAASARTTLTTPQRADIAQRRPIRSEAAFSSQD